MASLLLAVAAGLILVALTTWRPAIGCALIALAIPLTVGLGRNTVLPLLRPSEAIVLIVVAGLVLHYLPRRRALPLSGLDLIVGTFAVGVVVIPSLWLLLTHYPADLDRWRMVIGPLQFLVVYLVFSRTELSDRSVALCLNLALVASLVVGVVAIVQLTGILPGLRDFIETYYPPTELRAWESLHRPPSLLGHFSAVGAFAALNYTLALVLAATRHPRFSQTWLGLAMMVNGAAVLASLTVAPIVALLPLTAAVVWYARRIPHQLVVTAVATLVVTLVLLSPFLAGRLQEQEIGFAPGQDLSLPQTLDTRIGLWQAFFFPALAQDVWLGTGTVIPSEVPQGLTSNVDNEYLGLAFRAGVIGVLLLIGFLVGLAVMGLRGRKSPVPWVHALGGTVFSYAILVAAIGVSAEYLGYGGVLHQMAMVIGLLAGLTRPGALPVPRPAAPAHQRIAGWRLKPT